jgi:hypothetical protein
MVATPGKWQKIKPSNQDPQKHFNREEEEKKKQEY